MSGSENLQPGWQSADQGVTPFMVLLVLALVLGLRIVHMTCALRSPLMFQPGPDEEFYLRFGQAVARGTGDTPEFAFMDPAYGYFLGLIFKLLGTNLFVVYLVQVVLDTITIRPYGSGTITKSYNLAYTQGPTTNRLLLNSVTECSASSCLRPTTISYKSGNGSWAA
jgi:hypothetical protein